MSNSSERDSVGSLLISAVVAAFVFLLGYMYGSSLCVKRYQPAATCETQVERGVL